MIFKVQKNLSYIDKGALGYLCFSSIKSRFFRHQVLMHVILIRVQTMEHVWVN